MFSTILYIALLVGILIQWIALSAFLLWFGLRWAKVPYMTAGRVIGVSVVIWVLQLGLHLAFRMISPVSDAVELGFGLIELAAAVIIPCVILCQSFDMRFWRAFQALLPTTLAPVTAFAFGLFIIRPFLFEHFIAPTNPMAPTVVGEHLQHTCPECNQVNYGSLPVNSSQRSQPLEMICDNFHVTQVPDVSRKVYSADRFTIAKFLTPRRWDLIAFQVPNDPSIRYCMRLVGLPGEKVHIDDGAVWINGQRLSPPDSISGIRYLTDSRSLRNWFGDDLWGSPNRPAVLGDDEYFVLGDYSEHSMDSRLWKTGAPGHNPFAVPESHILGVAIHTYWPIGRWKILRKD